MKQLVRDKEHLWRMAGLFAAGIPVFLLVRALLVPDGFFVYGHFRAGALDDNAAQQMVFAGQESCVACHDDVVEERRGSRHATISCEGCHGPLGRHANDPSGVLPELPVIDSLCRGCHETNIARPAGFPQVEGDEHSDGEACDMCHIPHHPEVDL